MNGTFPPEIAQIILNAFAEASAANINALQQARDTQFVMNSLLQHEAQRLEKKLGRDNRCVQQVQESVKRNQAIARDLDVELEIAKISVPAVNSEEALIHGRVVDENYRGFAKLSIYLESEPDRIISLAGSAETNASGYYALQLNSVILKRVNALAPEGVFLIVRTPKGQLVYRKPDPLQLKEGDRILVEVVLNRSDLSPISVGKQPINLTQTPPPSTQPQAVQTRSQTDMGVVRGRVIDEQGRGVPELKVSALEQERRYDDKLGVAFTDENGEFSITYPYPETQPSGPNLYVTVLDAEGNQVYSSINAIRPNASREEVFEIRLQLRDL